MFFLRSNKAPFGIFRINREFPSLPATLNRYGEVLFFDDEQDARNYIKTHYPHGIKDIRIESIQTICVNLDERGMPC